MIFVTHKAETTRAGLEMNIFGYKCNCVEIAGDTYSLNMTLCWDYNGFEESSPNFRQIDTLIKYSRSWVQRSRSYKVIYGKFVYEIYQIFK